MTSDIAAPTDRTSFNGAMAAVLSDHATLRRLAVAAARRPASADDALSLAEAMAAHESAEAGLFALPFVTRPPKTVTSTAARARRRYLEYTSGDFHLPDPSAETALLVDALLAHLAAEEAWLALEKEHQHDRLATIA